MNKRLKDKKFYRRRPASPVRLSVVNCDSASGVNPSHSARVLMQASDGADLILACECFNISAERLLHDFHVAQIGTRGSSKSSTVVAVRKTRGRIIEKKLISGSPAWLAKRVRERYWLRTLVQIDDMKPRPYSSGHAVPKRAWALWGTYMSKAPRGVLGLDGNKHKRALKLRFPLRKVRQIGLMCAVIPRGIPASKAFAFDVGADHRAIKVVLWRK